MKLLLNYQSDGRQRNQWLGLTELILENDFRDELAEMHPVADHLNAFDNISSDLIRYLQYFECMLGPTGYTIGFYDNCMTLNEYNVLDIVKNYDLEGGTILDKKEHGFKRMGSVIENDIGNIKIYYKESDKHIVALKTNDRGLSMEQLLKLKLLFWSLIAPDDIRTEFYKLLVSKNQKDVNDFIEKHLSFEKLIREKELAILSILDKNHNLRYTELEERVQNAKDIVDNKLSLYNKAVAHLLELEEELELFNNTKAPDTSKTKDFIINNPYIVGIGTYYEGIKLQIEAPIIYFDKLKAKLVMKKQKEKSYEAKAIEVMLNPRYELWVTTAIVFYTNNFNVESCGKFKQTPNSREFINHPHITNYSCFGTHVIGIREWMKTRNYEGALTQILAAVMNLNFADGTVINRFLDLFRATYHAHRTFKDKKTGEFLTLEEIIRNEKTEN